MKEKERDSGGREKGCFYSEEQHCKKELELTAIEWTSLAKLEFWEVWAQTFKEQVHFYSVESR